MANVRSLARSFAGGEVTPEFYGRIDDAKFQTGLAECYNFMVLPHGPAANRPGTAFVRAVKNSAKRTRVIPFAYSSTQTMVLEVGDLYLRFHTQGSTLMDGAVPYEIATPFLADEVFDIRYEQDADILTLTHTLHPVQEVQRLGALSWTCTPATFASDMAAPTSVVATPTYVSGTTTTQTYVVTAIGGDEQDEGLKSATASCLNNLNAVGAYNTITWAAVTGADRYNVYKLDNGLYGFIGQAGGLSFVDDNITADVSQTPPEPYDPFSSADNYPAVVTHYEQRRAFGASLARPQTLWMTRPGTLDNLSYSIPTRDDDSIVARFAARDNQTIQHLVPLADLIMLTSSAVWRVFSTGGAISPFTLAVKPQSYIGANNVRPVATDTTLLFAANRGGHIRHMVYSTEGGGYQTTDLSLRAPHLFDELNIVDMAFQKSPYPIVWAVSSDGSLIGLTYVPEHEIFAWHKHETDGLVESVCVVAEGAQDAVYFVVKRQIALQDVRYIERLATRAITDQEDCFFVDAGVSYSGAPITTINSGLSHLEGCEVAILADGAVHPRRTVTAGVVELEAAASVIQIGLPYTARLRTLPLAFEAQAAAQGRPKNVNEVILRVSQSGGFSAGPNLSSMYAAKLRTNEPYGSPPALRTGEVSVKVNPEWTDGGQIYVEVTDPVPVTVVSMVLETSVGG